MNLNSVLLNLGFLPDKASFLYIKTYVNSEDGRSFKTLLNEIAKKFNTTFGNVYDSIRRAIILADNYGKLKNIDSYFGVPVYNENYLLSVSKFLSLIKLLFSKQEMAI